MKHGKVNFSVLRIMALIGLYSWVTACTHNNPTQTQNNIPLAATLSSLQANVFTPQCVNAGCHPGSGAPFSLATGQSYANLVNMPSTYQGLQRVTPGNAQLSSLYLKTLGRLGARMPPSGSALTQAQSDSLATWINRGALNN